MAYTFDLIRGDRWDGPQLQWKHTANTSFDWTGTTARCQLRFGSKDGPLSHEFAITPSYPNTANMTATLAITSSVSQSLRVGNHYGDVEIYRSSPALGPYTWFTFTLKVAADATHPNG